MWHKLLYKGGGGLGAETPVFQLFNFFRGVVRGEANLQLLSPYKLNNILVELVFQFILK